MKSTLKIRNLLHLPLTTVIKQQNPDWAWRVQKSKLIWLRAELPGGFFVLNPINTFLRHHNLKMRHSVSLSGLSGTDASQSPGSRLSHHSLCCTHCCIAACKRAAPAPSLLWTAEILGVKLKLHQEQKMKKTEWGVAFFILKVQICSPELKTGATFWLCLQRRVPKGWKESKEVMSVGGSEGRGSGGREWLTDIIGLICHWVNSTEMESNASAETYRCVQRNEGLYFSFWSALIYVFSSSSDCIYSKLQLYWQGTHELWNLTNKDNFVEQESVILNSLTAAGP